MPSHTRAHVTRPAIALPAHRVTNEQIAADVAAHRPAGQERLAGVRRLIANTGVGVRYWTRPFAEAIAPSSIADRNPHAFAAAVGLAEQAARTALADAGLGPADVDCIVTSHTTSWSVPNLDVHLVERLGLRPDVSRRPIATLACAGGAQALIYATDYVRAHPGATVLVAVGETLETIYHQDEVEPKFVGYKALFGSVGAACLVTADRLGPGLAIDDTLEHVLPGSLEGGRPVHYWGSIDAAGLHFDSTVKAMTAADDTVPHLQKWLGGRSAAWCAIHPGSPGIINTIADGLGLNGPTDGRHSHTTLAEAGNLGGGAILDVLRRTHEDPPPTGAPGVVVAFGPGFVTAGLYGTWT